MTPSMRRPKLRRPRRPEGRNPRPARPFAPPGPRRPRICGKRNFPLDFARRIRYNNIHDKPVRRDAEGVARDLLRQMHRALQCFGGRPRRSAAGRARARSRDIPIGRCGGMADANDSKSFGKPCGFESHHRHQAGPGRSLRSRPGFFVCRLQRAFLVLDTGALHPYNKHRHCKKDGDRDDL